MKRRFALVAAAAAMLALSACTSSTPKPTPSTALLPAPGAASGSPGTSTVNWTPCSDVASQILNQPVRGYTFDCGSIKVPQDWQHPTDGKTFNLALIRVRNDNQSNRIGSLLVNPGGPGASGIELAVDLTQELPNALTDRFDLVGFDPRGVGHSTEVNASARRTRTNSTRTTPDPVSAAAVQLDRRPTRNRPKRRAARSTATQLPLFSTEQAAARHGRDPLGRRRLETQLPRLLVRHAARRRIRPTVPDEDPGDGARRRGRPAAGRRGAVGSPGRRLRAGVRQTSPPGARTTRANARSWKNPRGAVTSAIAAAGKAPVTNADGRKATDGWVYYGIISAMYSQQALARPRPGHRPARPAQPAPDHGAGRPVRRARRERQLLEPVRREPRRELRRLAANRPSPQVRQLQSQWRTKYPMFGASAAVGLLSCAAGDGRARTIRTRPARPWAPRRSWSSVRRATRPRRTRHREARQHAGRGPGADLAGRGPHGLPSRRRASPTPSTATC